MKGHARTLIHILQKELDSEPVRGAEIGVWLGSMSINLLKFFPDMKLLMVDRYEVYPPGSPDRIMTRKTISSFTMLVIHLMQSFLI
jgi:hypothetical protein